MARKKIPKFEWRPGSPYSRRGDADELGRELYKLAKKYNVEEVAQLSLDVIIEEARGGNAVLAAYFDFDHPENAAMQHWRRIAGELRIAVRIRVIESPGGVSRPVAAMVKVKINGQSTHVPTTLVMVTDLLKDQMFSAGVLAICAVARKYVALGGFDLLDRIIKRSLEVLREEDEKREAV